QYLAQGTRSSRVETQLWQALFDLTQVFLQCYQAFARELADRPQDSKWQAMLPELIARQAGHQGLEAKFRLFRYAQWIPAKRGALNSLFQQACSAQIERQSVAALPDGTATTIEQEYLRLLVMQVMHSGNITPRNLQWISEQLPQWCAPLRLNIESS